MNQQETKSSEMPIAVWHSVIATPLGDLTVVRDEIGLQGLYFPHHWYRPTQVTFGPRRDAGFEDTATQLGEYLAGRRRNFEVALSMHGDAFQKTVWRLVADIPYGDTVTYGQLAAQLGDNVNAQQVGAAVGRNPVCVIVPCHRVVGAGGKLTGYAGGLARKRMLLDLERDHVSRSNGSPFQDALLRVVV